LTESASILKIPNRRGIQSKWDFLAGLEIWGPGGPFLGKWGPGDPSFTSTPRAGALSPDFAGVEKEGFSPPGGEVWIWTSGGPGRPLGAPPAPAGDRAPPRGVDVKPPSLARSRPDSGTPGLRRSPDLGSGFPGPRAPPGGPGGIPSGIRDPVPDVSGTWSPDPSGIGNRASEPLPGSPRPRGRGCFTSTPRAGALRPGGAGYPALVKRQLPVGVTGAG